MSDIDRMKKDLLSGMRETVESETLSNRRNRLVTRQRLTCGHRAHQHTVELNDGAENMFGICSACHVFTVTLKDEALILFL